MHTPRSSVRPEAHAEEEFPAETERHSGVLSCPPFLSAASSPAQRVGRRGSAAGMRDSMRRYGASSEFRNVLDPATAQGESQSAGSGACISYALAVT